ncbi:hypothetical protein FOL47_003137 [Perkinsus chesapeaki]|uniref:Uncharacterized protein n=1 Tax=Perkinsus chesapeaki TaxID=330153 RepID=A0A7J6M9L0_PERCH|nr:hypothetical protein FOL47_003137 [Perkinsus chesapeaki]
MALLRSVSMTALEKTPGHPKSITNLAQVSFPDPPTEETYATCKRVFQSAGGLLAVPLRPRIVRTQSIPAFPISTYRGDFANQPVTSCGASNKPLGPYHPNANRSRLPAEKFKPMWRNKSDVMIEVRDIKDPRQFWTTHRQVDGKALYVHRLLFRNYHRGAGGVQSANLSIVANKTKYFHQFQQQG